MDQTLSIVARTACHDGTLDLLLADALVRSSLSPEARVGAEPSWQAQDSRFDCVLLCGGSRVLGGARIDQATLAFFIGREFWGRGYARRMVELLLKDWDGAAGGALVALCAGANLPSQKVLLANGFRFSGREIGVQGVNLRFNRPAP